MKIAAFTVGALLASTSAFADQITFADSVQSIVFAGNGDGTITISTLDSSPNPTPQGQIDMTAIDSTNPGTTGGAWFVNFPTVRIGIEMDGLFPVNAPAEFKYVAADGDEIDESIVITQIQDNTVNAKFYFTGTTTAITGDPDFLTAYGPVGSQDHGDWIQNSLWTTLDALALTTASAASTISAGETTPSTVPEPSTTILFLGTMLAAFGVARYGWRGSLDGAV